MNRIQYYRERRRMTQRELAAAARLSPCMISRIEHGKRTPSLRALQRIATALRIPTMDLIDDLPQEHRP